MGNHLPQNDLADVPRAAVAADLALANIEMARALDTFRREIALSPEWAEEAVKPGSRSGR